MIINSDEKIYTVVTEDIIITNSSTLSVYGIVNGNVYVEENSNFYLNGILNGNLTAKQNSYSQLIGTMNGDILQSDGNIQLSGILHTKLVIPDNLIKITGCHINGTRY